MFFSLISSSSSRLNLQFGVSVEASGKILDSWFMASTPTRCISAIHPCCGFLMNLFFRIGFFFFYLFFIIKCLLLSSSVVSAQFLLLFCYKQNDLEDYVVMLFIQCIYYNILSCKKILFQSAVQDQTCTLYTFFSCCCCCCRGSFSKCS